MSTRVKTETVTLKCVKEIIIEGGLRLPAGVYVGTRKQLGLAGMKGTSWTQPEYRIEFTEEQVAAMAGRAPNPDAISQEVDVTAQVRSGELSVTVGRF